MFNNFFLFVCFIFYFINLFVWGFFCLFILLILQDQTLTKNEKGVFSYFLFDMVYMSKSLPGAAVSVNLTKIRRRSVSVGVQECRMWLLIVSCFFSCDPHYKTAVRLKARNVLSLSLSCNTSLLFSSSAAEKHWSAHTLIAVKALLSFPEASGVYLKSAEATLSSHRPNHPQLQAHSNTLFEGCCIWIFTVDS